MGPDHAEMLSTLPVLPNAECRDIPNPDIFFPEDVRNFHQRVLVAGEALDLCAICPEIAACLKFGMERENLSYGIYGGTLAGERMTLARSRNRQAFALAHDAKVIRRKLRELDEGEGAA